MAYAYSILAASAFQHVDRPQARSGKGCVEGMVEKEKVVNPKKQRSTPAFVRIADLAEAKALQPHRFANKAFLEPAS